MRLPRPKRAHQDQGQTVIARPRSRMQHPDGKDLGLDIDLASLECMDSDIEKVFT